MEEKYNDLYSLLQQDSNAMAYYSELPYYVKQAMGYRADSVNSFESLRHYAENLTRGDL